MGDVPTKEEARAALVAAMTAALGMTRSRRLAEEIVQDAFERVMTTRPWSRKERTFEQHMVGTVWSLVSHEFASKRSEHDAEAHDGFHREEAGQSAASPEDKMLDRAEQENRWASADEELDALAESVAGHPAAREVLRCRREHGLTKASEIAARIGLPVEQVYRANEVLRDHLRSLRKKRKKASGEG